MALAATGAVAGGDPAPVEDDSWLFDPARVLEVRLDLDPADWDRLRAQTREYLDVYGGDCLSRPVHNPFTWFLARLTIEGRVFETISVRKKGFFGSLDTRRPALKIHLARVDKNTRLAGHKRLNLLNSKEDPSLVRTCLGYGLFERAGLLAPRCNWAHLVVNGRDLGVYVQVEEVDGAFARRRFSGAEATLFELENSDFDPGWLGTLQQLNHKDEPERRGVIDRVTQALLSPDADLPAVLGRWIDLDRFLTYWALENLLGSVDGYTGGMNNTRLVALAAGKLEFVPWGLDTILQLGLIDIDGAPEAVYENSILAGRLYQLSEFRQRLERRMAKLLEKLWDADALWAEVERDLGRLWPYLRPEQRTAALQSTDDLRDVLCLRVWDLKLALAEGLPERPIDLWDPPCFHP